MKQKRSFFIELYASLVGFIFGLLYGELIAYMESRYILGDPWRLCLPMLLSGSVWFLLPPC